MSLGDREGETNDEAEPEDLPAADSRDRPAMDRGKGKGCQSTGGAALSVFRRFSKRVWCDLF